MVKLDRVTSRWGSYPVETSSISQAQQGKGKRSAAMIGGGAGLGALIGGLAGGGKGAAIGALAGGGAGTAGTAFTGNKQIVLPAETLLHSSSITRCASRKSTGRMIRNYSSAKSAIQKRYEADQMVQPGSPLLTRPSDCRT